MALGFRLLPQAPPVAGNPANNYDFPNPNKGPSRLSNICDYTWIQSPTPIVPAFVPRSPTTVPYRTPYRDPSLYTWISYPRQVQPNPPINQHDFPNPSKGPQRLQDYSWQASLPPTFINPPMRIMDWPNPQIPRRPVDLLTHLNINTIRTQIVNPSIFPQFDFPNPQLRKPLDYTFLGTHTQTPIIPPIGQYTWPNPPGSRQPTLSWTIPGINTFQAPFQNYDYPNPRGAPRLTDYTHLDTGTVQMFVLGPPITNLDDWPNPIRRPYVDYTFLSQGPSPPTQLVNPGFTTSDFPNPRLAAKSYIPQVYRPDAVPPPIVNPGFTTSDFPNPIRPQVFDYLNSNDQDWISIDIIPPPSIYDWPNPPGPRPRVVQDWVYGYVTPPPAPSNVTSGAVVITPRWEKPRLASLYTWTSNGIPSTGVVPFPFSLDDWPNPVRRLPLDYTYLNDSLPLPASILPTYIINQDDWPNPQIRYSNDLKSWVVVLNQPLNVPTFPPVRQYDWPNPRAALYPSDLRTFTDNTYILPIPPPVVVIPSQNFRQPGFGPGTMGMMGGFHN